MNIRDAENGYEAVGAEEAAVQSRVIAAFTSKVVSHADENMICVLQAFLVAMQAARTFGADEPSERRFFARRGCTRNSAAADAMHHFGREVQS